jgi:hypothetical protein
MCLALYLATDKSLGLPTKKWFRFWEKQRSEFSLICHTDELYKKYIQEKVSFNYIYGIISSEGCACKFMKDDPAALEDAQKEYATLYNYIKETKECEIYCCWQGDEFEACESEKSIKKEDLLMKAFEFKEKTLYRFS